jgi:hypothetical protein
LLEELGRFRVHTHSSEDNTEVIFVTVQDVFVGTFC